MEFSKFGQKLAGQSGINILMEDLGAALGGGREMLMLGGGNPAHIPAVEAHFRAAMENLLAQPGAFERAVGDYDAPRGNAAFIAALAALLRREYGWDVTERNIALTNGSQSAFFALFNFFAGEFEGGRRKKILLPLAPEYIGYADTGAAGDFFVSARPEIEHIDDVLFKYHVDFDALPLNDSVGAICVSRPTNPTGNVLTDAEIERLAALASRHSIPFIQDNAYGPPFPNIVAGEASPHWDENSILCMSLSKLGLPALRTGIVVAREEITAAIANLNAVTNLAPGRFGAALATRMVETGEILKLARETVGPFYRARAEAAVAQLRAEMTGLDFHLHRPEGAIFLWLWFRDFPIGSGEFYERLKKRGVLVVPGHYFFSGLEGEWRHTRECIRVSYAQSEDVVRRGLAIIAGEARRAYGE